MLKNRVVKQTIRKEEKNSKIVTIHNKYKDILDSFIYSSDLEFLAGLIEERFGNTPRFRSGLTNLLKTDCLEKNVLVWNKSLQLEPKIEDF